MKFRKTKPKQEIKNMNKDAGAILTFGVALADQNHYIVSEWPWGEGEGGGERGKTVDTP